MNVAPCRYVHRVVEFLPLITSSNPAKPRPSTRGAWESACGRWLFVRGSGSDGIPKSRWVVDGMFEETMLWLDQIGLSPETTTFPTRRAAAEALELALAGLPE